MTLQKKKKTFEMWNGTKTVSYIVQEMDGIECSEQKNKVISPCDTQTQKTTVTKRKLSSTDIGTSSNITTIDEIDRTNKGRTVEDNGGSQIITMKEDEPKLQKGEKKKRTCKSSVNDINWKSYYSGFLEPLDMGLVFHLCDKN